MRLTRSDEEDDDLLTALNHAAGGKGKAKWSDDEP
jgi:hypothetical protein